MLDAVPLDAEIIVESADSALIMMFDSLLGSHVSTERMVNGKPMAIVMVPKDDQKEFVLLTNPSRKDFQEEKIYDDANFNRLQKTLGQNVKAHLYYKDPRGWVALDVLPEGQDLVDFVLREARPACGSGAAGDSAKASRSRGRFRQGSDSSGSAISVSARARRRRNR